MCYPTGRSPQRQEVEVLAWLLLGLAGTISVEMQSALVSEGCLAQMPLTPVKEDAAIMRPAGTASSLVSDLFLI